MTSPSRTGLSFAGEYVLEDCTIETRDGVSLNIVNQVAGIVIYEDIFSPFISGSLILRDTHDLPNLFGRSGMNVMSLKISTPALPEKTCIVGNFHVYKQYERSLTKAREQSYSLAFISIEAVSDQQKLSRSFSGHPEKIADSILRKDLNTRKNYLFTETSNNIKYVSNFWTPSKNMTYLAENAKKSEGVSNFMFYENRDGFNFRNISDIADEKPLQKFSYNDYLTEERSTATPQYVYRDPNLDYSKIIELHIDTTYDYERDRIAGVIKTSLFVPDPIVKRYKKIRYSMDADKSQRLNKELPYSDKVIALTDNFTETQTRFYNAFDRGDPTNLNFIQTRIAQLQRYQSFKIEIEVLGRMDYTVGKKVFVEFPLTKNISKDDDPIDKLYTGNYIIAAIAHRFNGDKHMCSLELIKDSTLLK